MQNFGRDILLLVNDVARLVRTRFDQRARARGMTRAQWIILAMLDRRPGLSQNELAAALEVEPISVGRLIDRLEARGLVERRPDPADRRVRRLHLLSEARPFLDDIDAQRELLSAEILDGIDPESRSLVVESLLRMKSNLTETPQPKAVGE
jgi:DNA-binding MarR family transcriptional regulator